MGDILVQIAQLGKAVWLAAIKQQIEWFFSLQ